MIDAAEYLQLRQRVLIAAEAAYRIAASPHQVVFWELDEYELVLQAMLSLKTDIRRLVAECQILRGENDGVVSVRIVGGVPAGTDHPGGREERLFDAATTVGVPASGPDGPGEGRPKPRRNTRTNRTPAAKVDKGRRGKSVDRAE
jgi:hypothetical protein